MAQEQLQEQLHLLYRISDFTKLDDIDEGSYNKLFNFMRFGNVGKLK